MPGAWPVWTPGARLAGFVKRTTIHCYTQNMKALGLVFFQYHCKSMGANDPSPPPPRARPVWTPGARLAGIIKRTTIHCYTQNIKALGLVVSEKKIFYVFPIVSLWKIMTPGAWPFLTPGAWLAGFIKRTTTHYYTQNMKALGPLVLEKKIFYVFPIVSLWELMTPGAGPFLNPGARLAGFIKRITTHCYIQSMKGLGLVVTEKRIFLCFSHDAPGAGPVWTPGARLAGIIKRTTIHCYTQNMKALGLLVSEKKIFFMFFPHCKSMGAICCHGNQSSDPTWPKT